jgi:hypothetical protein
VQAGNTLSKMLPRQIRPTGIHFPSPFLPSFSACARGVRITATSAGMGDPMQATPPSGRKPLKHRGPPTPSLRFASPQDPKKLVEEARAARPALPHQLLINVVGGALGKFYGIEPLPPELLGLLNSLKEHPPSHP